MSPTHQQMHEEYKQSFQHDFGQAQKTQAEKRTFYVMVLTFVTMFVEIISGWFTHSVALLADGIHMGGHALALALAFSAYYFVRRYANDRRFSFGSGKINDLVAYSTSILLIITTIFILVESIERLIHPQPILAMEAFLIALAGLIINLISAYILHGVDDVDLGHNHAHGHSHAHGHTHEHTHSHNHGHTHSHAHSHVPNHTHNHIHTHIHPHLEVHAHSHTHQVVDMHNDKESKNSGHSFHEPQHEESSHKKVTKNIDNNLQAAIIHVLSDAATSVAAMIGILCAWLWKWYWVDPIIALVASIVIGKWAITLLKQTAVVLLDAHSNEEMYQEIEKILKEQVDTEIVDLHVWQVGNNAWTMMAALIHHGNLTPEDYKKSLQHIDNLYHPIIEVQCCHDCPEK